MARGKARLKGNSQEQLVEWRFDEDTRKKIKALYLEAENWMGRERADIQNEVWGPSTPIAFPADIFVNVIENETRWAKDRTVVANFEYDGIKKNIVAELDYLKKRLEEIQKGFRSLSSGVSSLFHIGFDPLSCASDIEIYSQYVEAALGKAKQLPVKEKQNKLDGDISIELAIRVLRVAKEHGITRTKEWVSLLGLVGESVSLSKDPHTWEHILVQVRSKAPDLKNRECSEFCVRVCDSRSTAQASGSGSQL